MKREELDDLLDKRLSQFEERIEQQLAKFFGQVTAHFDERFKALEAKVDAKADGERVYSMLDGIAKRLVDDDQERAAMSHQLDRHDSWIGQLAENTSTKLTPPLAE